MSDKVVFKNVWGGEVAVDVAELGNLIASVQCLPEAMEGGDGEPQHTIGVIRSRFEALGIPFDRRDTKDYQKEIASDDDDFVVDPPIP